MTAGLTCGASHVLRISIMVAIVTGLLGQQRRIKLVSKHCFGLLALLRQLLACDGAIIIVDAGGRIVRSSGAHGRLVFCCPISIRSILLK